MTRIYKNDLIPVKMRELDIEMSVVSIVTQGIKLYVRLIVL